MARPGCPGQRLSRSAGFTLLELITVLVMLGVLATVVATRFQDDTGYTEYTAQQRLIAALRHMQVQAMQDSRPGFCHRIVFSYGANNGFGPSTATYNAGDQTASCSLTIDTRAPQNLQANASELSGKGVSLSSSEAYGASLAFIGFDDLGGVLTHDGRRPPTNYNCTIAPPCRITFAGESQVSVCVENSGYIYAC